VLPPLLFLSGSLCDDAVEAIVIVRFVSSERAAFNEVAS
jgi:hypothetical protein